MQVSKLVFYSVGIVAVNKPLSTHDVEITPIEDLTMIDGEVTDNLTTRNIQGRDADGAAFETTIKSSATVTARWLPFSSNRLTAPDVRRGEKVAIWRFADADKYYWSELEYEANHRKLETVIYCFSATQDEGAENSKETSYFLEISTHNKLVHFHTTKVNGEKFSYDLQLNTKDGVFIFKDDIDNIISLDSTLKRLTLRNASNSYIDLHDKNLSINVVDNMNINVGGNYTLNVGGNYKATAADVLFTSPKVSTSAQMVVGSSLAVTNGMTTGSGGGGEIRIGGGNLIIEGNVVGSGTATFSGNVSAPNIN